MRRCSAVAGLLTLAGPEQYEKCLQLLEEERPAGPVQQPLSRSALSGPCRSHATGHDFEHRS
jgi:hypothetical protein